MIFGLSKKKELGFYFFRTSPVTWVSSDSVSIFTFPLKSIAELPGVEEGSISSKVSVVERRSN